MDLSIGTVLKTNDVISGIGSQLDGQNLTHFLPQPLQTKHSSTGLNDDQLNQLQQNFNRSLPIQQRHLDAVSSESEVIPLTANRSRFLMSSDTKKGGDHSRQEHTGDRLTGIAKDDRFVGTADHYEINQDSLHRNLRVSAPAFPGRLMKYTPGQPMMRGEDIRQWQAQMRQRGWSIDIDGIYGSQSDRVCRAFQAEKRLGADGIVGPQTWNAAFVLPVTPLPPPPSPSNVTGQAIADLARNIVEGRYNGGQRPQYVFGAENNSFDPASVRRTDCSELVQVVASTLLKKTWVDGSWNQYANCQKISVAQALRTPGALLFVTNGRRIHHVAVSLGNGYTAEARSTRSGVRVFRAGSFFNLAGLIPGIKY